MSQVAEAPSVSTGGDLLLGPVQDREGLGLRDWLPPTGTPGIQSLFRHSGRRMGTFSSLGSEAASSPCRAGPGCEAGHGLSLIHI